MIVGVNKAVKLLKEGRNVAIPTETVYGLAADATHAAAIRKTFELKKRPPDNPLIIHLLGAEQIERFSDAGQNLYQSLTDAFWPGPLTIVLPRKNTVLDVITAGLDSVALRMPDHATTLEIISSAGPVTAPSANLSGRPSPTKPEHVIQDFGDQLPVVDGGTCDVGIESTVLDLTGDRPVILRPGKISAEELADCLGKPVEMGSSEDEQLKKSPGTRYTHYKPGATVQWMKSPKKLAFSDDALYIFHTFSPEYQGPNIVHLRGDFYDLARSIYDLYRTADLKNYSAIWIEPLPDSASHPIIPALFNRIERSVAQ